MAGLALFRALNFLAIENFFAGADCERMAAAMRDSPSESAMVGVEGAVDETQRRTRAVVVLPELHRRAVERFEAIRDTAASHFGVELSAMERPQFLRYRPGDHFIRHMDRDRAGLNRRQVSLIAFLNADFDGGALRFGGFDGAIPLRLPPVPGLLLLFRSDWIHEVEPVTRGERFTIVSWFA
jgi:predicted 2-oxoglutarate/Fe(II)-dependent dioxygenase YbiX